MNVPPIILAIVSFIVLVGLERLCLYRAIGFDLRKDPPSEKEILSRFGWVKLPRTLIIAGCAVFYALPLEHNYKFAGALVFVILYMLCAIWDTSVAMRIIKRK